MARLLVQHDRNPSRGLLQERRRAESQVIRLAQAKQSGQLSRPLLHSVHALADCQEARTQEAEN